VASHNQWQSKTRFSLNWTTSVFNSTVTIDEPQKTNPCSHVGTPEPESYVTTDGQLASLSWCQAPICGLRPDFCYCQTVACCWCGTLSWQEESVVYSCCWFSPAQSLLGLSPVGLVTIFYCLRFETPATWRTRSPYLYPPGTGWPSYTPTHWVPISSPPTTRRATVEVSEYRSPSQTVRVLFCVIRYHGNQWAVA
jgi:hypothetical protein